MKPIRITATLETALDVLKDWLQYHNDPNMELDELISRSRKVCGYEVEECDRCGQPNCNKEKARSALDSLSHLCACKGKDKK